MLNPVVVALLAPTLGFAADPGRTETVAFAKGPSSKSLSGQIKVDDLIAAEGRQTLQVFR